MTKEIGNVFAGVISGLNEYGLFVSLNATGVTGFVPVRNLGRDFFTFDRKHKIFKGGRSQQTFMLGDAITIRVQEANAMTGSLIFGLEASEITGAPPLREKYKNGKNTEKHSADKNDKNKGKRFSKKK
jgi:ribonuclease R